MRSASPELGQKLIASKYPKLKERVEAKKSDIKLGCSKYRWIKAPNRQFRLLSQNAHCQSGLVRNPQRTNPRYQCYRTKGVWLRIVKLRLRLLLWVKCCLLTLNWIYFFYFANLFNYIQTYHKPNFWYQLNKDHSTYYRIPFSVYSTNPFLSNLSTDALMIYPYK